MKIQGAFPVRWAAQDGKPGAGVTIVQTMTRYSKSTNGQTPPSLWEDTIPSVEDGKYLWTWVYVRYSDGTETNSYSVARMGIDGKGIKSSVVSYSMKETSVSPESITDWGEFPSELIDGYWLYTKTHIVYSDEESTDSYSVSQVGVGAYYAGCQEYWAVGKSNTTPPDGAPTPGTYANGQHINTTWTQDRVATSSDYPYLWNFEISADSRGNRYVTDAICVGNFAKGIVSIVELYAISAYGTADNEIKYPSDISGTDWKDEQNAAAPTEEKRYQWNWTSITYNDGTTENHYHVSAVKGIDGKGAVYIDLDNENDSMLYDGAGNLVSGNVTSNMTLYENGKPASQQPSFSAVGGSNLTAQILGTTLTVSNVTGNGGFVIVQCLYKGVYYTARMTVKRLVGVDKYDISLDHNSVTYNETKCVLSTATIKLNIYRTAQNGTKSRIANQTELNNFGLTAKVYPNGISSNAEDITFSASAVGTISLTSDKAKTWNDFAVVIFRNGVEEDRETVPIGKVEDGNEGHGAIFLDLDNENDSMLYDGANSLISGNVVSQAKLLDAGEDKTSYVSKWEMKDVSGLTGSINSSGQITITGMTAISGTATAYATYNGNVYTAKLTVKKLVGVDKYEIVCNPNALTYNTTKKTGAYQSVNVKVYRTGQNGSRELVQLLGDYGLSLTYTYDSSNEYTIEDGSSSGQYFEGCTRNLTASTYSLYKFFLYKDGVIQDVETIPISKTSDGKNGSAGADSIILDLDNENDTILYDGADNPISDVVLSQARLYKGSNMESSGITWGIVSADCTGVSVANGGDATSTSYDRATYPDKAWITASGLVYVNGISGSQAVVVVKAVYGGNTYTTKLTIKKLRGIDKYDIVTTPSALTYNSSTGLINGASSVTVNVEVWRTAQNGERTKVTDYNGSNIYGLSLSVNKYSSLTSQTYGCTFGVNKSVASANSSIEITLKKNSLTLDAETIPIAKTTNGSGTAGPGAKSIYALSFDKPATPSGATPWTATDIWKESPEEDAQINISQQGDWIRDEEGYMRAPSIGTNQTTIQTIMFVTTETNEVIHIRAKCNTSAYANLYIGNVDSTQPTANYFRKISGSSQDTGDLDVTIGTVGQHFICVCYTRGSYSDDYAKFIVGKRHVWRSDAKSFTSTGSVASWTDPVRVSEDSTDVAPQTRGNLLFQSAFLPTRLDKWVSHNGQTTDGLDGRNGFLGTPDYTVESTEYLAQNIYEPSGDKKLLANTWYTLSFWAKSAPYIQIDKYETSEAYGFARVTKIYLLAGAQNTLWVNGYVSSAALNAGKVMRVYVFGDGETSSWGSSKAIIDINSTSSVTKSISFSVDKTGYYQIASYVYLKPNGQNDAVSGHTATLNWYRIDRGMRMTSYLWPTTGEQSSNTSLDITAGRIKDGQYVASTPTDNNAEWQLTEVWTRHTLTFKTRSYIPDVTHQLKFSMRQASNACYISMPKLEQGTVATAFCTNENDVSDMAADESGFPNDRGIWVDKPSEPYIWNNVRRDYVIHEIGGEWFTFFVKRKGMTVPEGHNPSSGGTTYWEQGNRYSNILTNTIIGENANIGGFLATNQVFKSANEKLVLNGLLGIIQLIHEDGYVWEVNEEGNQTLGIHDGQRIEINPSTKDIRIFDSNGKCISIFEGNTYDSLSSLFGNSSGTISEYGTEANRSVTKTIATSNTLEAKLYGDSVVCGFTTGTPTEIRVIMSIKAMSYSEPYVSTGSVSQIRPMSKGEANVTIRIKTYKSKTDKTLIQSQSVDSVTASSSADSIVPSQAVSKTESKKVDKIVSSIAGYHEVVVSWSQSAIVKGSWAQCAWGNAISGGTSPNVSYNSEFYVSRFFANGFALGIRSDNFVAAYRDTNGMNFVAQNGNYGVKVSNSSVQIRVGDTSWRTIKIESGYLKVT